MSLDQAQAVIKKIKTDSVFKKEIMSIHNIEKRIELLNKAGFKVTIEDLNKLTDTDQKFIKKCGEHVINFSSTVA